MGIITKYFKLDSLPNPIQAQVVEMAKEKEVNIASVDYVRKGLEVYKEPDFIPGEKSVISYISTGTMDRDGDILKPDGCDLTHFMKHPIVMFGHDYKKLPLGRACWIKTDVNNHGLIGKVIYANTPEADLVYNYRKDGFPLAQSVGFCTLKSISSSDINRKDEYEIELKNAISKGWITKDNTNKVNKIIQKWGLIEWSDVSVPCNVEALQIAVSKGIISKDEYVEELKHIKEYEVSKDNMKTIIQIDGLKDISKIEDKKEEVKKVEESTKTLEGVVKEISKDKTISPPLDLVSKNIVDNVEQKKSDKKGNPSTRDIQEALYSNIKKMREDMDKMHAEKGITIKYDDGYSTSYMGVEDLYPIDYPNGHVICGYCSDVSAPMMYCDYKYKYDAESRTAEIGKMTEMDVSYVPKGICHTEIDKINRNKDLNNKFSEQTLKLEELKNIPNLPIIINNDLIDELGNAVGLVIDKSDNLYQIRLNKIYIEGAKYTQEKQKQALEHFSKFVSDEPKSMDEWKNIQSKLIEFFVTSAPGKEEIIKFCKDNNLKHKDYITKEQEEDEIIEKGVDETENEIRIRVQDPSLFDQDSFRYKTIKASKPRVKAVFGKKKGSSSMELQAYRFPKAEWTRKAAIEWVRVHGKKSLDIEKDCEDEMSEEFIKNILQENNKNIINNFQEIMAKLIGKAQI